MRKICVDWAKSLKDSEDKFFPFKIILPLSLKKGAKLEDMLKDQFNLDELQVKVVKWNLKCQPEKVLFLFDELDENEEENLNMVLGLLKKNRKSKYILASRVEHLDKVKLIKKYWDTDIMIVPMDFKAITDYIDKFFVN